MPNKNPNQINDTQLLNIVAFCALMENNGGLLGDEVHAGKAPTYLLEKFQRYALSDEAEIYWGLDLVRQATVALWAKKWNINIPEVPDETE